MMGGNAHESKVLGEFHIPYLPGIQSPLCDFTEHPQTVLHKDEIYFNYATAGWRPLPQDI